MADHWFDHSADPHVRDRRMGMARGAIRLLLFALLASNSVALTLANTNFHFHLLGTRTAFETMVEGRADRPYAYRALAPAVVRILAASTPGIFHQKAVVLVEQKATLRSFGYRPTNALAYFYGHVLMWASVLAFAYVLRAMLEQACGEPNLADVGAAVAVLTLPAFRAYFVYDFPHLLLFSTCLWLLASRKLGLLYPAFVLACASKETALLVPMVMLLTRSWYRLSSKRVASHALALCCIWLAVSVWLRWVFRNNPGSLVEFHLFGHNVPVLLAPSSWLAVSVNLFPMGLNPLLWAPPFLLAVAWWHDKPPFYRGAAWIAGPLLGLALFFGWIEETRTYLELLAPITVLGMHSVSRIFGRPDGTRPRG